MPKENKPLNSLDPLEEMIAQSFADEMIARERAIQEHNSNPHRKYHITPFGNQVNAKFKDGKTIGISRWNCEETFLKLKKCIYDVDQDQHCDHCLRCGKALDRRRD